ncbi:Endocytosis and vacuole integrity protein, partial [Coemansia sp. BCRC 34301]
MATTNLSALLLGELQSLSTEARRKHPDIKEAAERVIVVLRGIKATATEEIAEELSKSDEVIRPFVLACGSGNQRLTTIAVHCLQQLVSRRAISSGSVRETLSTLHHVSGQGVEIQVKVLQMILPLVTLYGDSVGGEALVDAFALCLTLQRSRDPVVSNTAAAILRQAVVAVFDRVVAEDGHESCDMTVEQDLARRCAKDAYFVLQDLCLLAADAAPIFIRAEHHVDKRLVLELIESVLTNHAAVVARHAAMAQTLRERLAPFIVNFFAERSAFALAVRCTRIAWLFVRELHRHLTPECEILLSVLARLIDSRKKSSGSKLHSSVSTMTGGAFPLFYSVVALEVVHDLLETPALLHQLYLLYDGRVGHDSEEEDCHVILDLISAVCRVVVERSDLRASSSSIPHAPTDDALPAGDGSSLAVLSSDVVTGQQQQQQQIGARACRIRMELYKLLDKQEAPNVPDLYSFYLAASAIIGFGEGLAASILDSETGCGREFMRHAWTTAIYPVYEFIMGVRFDDAMFARMLGSAQRLVESAGILGLMEERDALLSLLCRGCLPTTQQSVGGDVVSSRQVQCVRAVIGCAQFLVSSLGPAWYMVLATVQCVEEALYANRGGRVAGATPVIGTSGSEDNIGGSGNQLLLSTDLTAVRDDFARLLAAVRRARGDAILWMIRGLQVLGSDLSGIQVRVEGLEDMRRLGGERLRGNAAVGVQVRPTFAVEELRAFAVANIDLLMGAVTDDESTNNDIGQQAWTAVVDHLLATATGAVTPAGMRTQACEAVSDVVLAAMDLVTTSSSGSGKFRAMVESGSAQVRILQPLSQMMATGSGDHHQAMTVRKLTLDTLHRVLQASGHSITAAWSVVFDIIQS